MVYFTLPRILSIVYRSVNGAVVLAPAFGVMSYSNKIASTLASASSRTN